MPPTKEAPGPLLSLLIWFLKAWDASPLRWEKWPVWTFVPLLYLLLRRAVLHSNLIFVPLPEGTQLARRVQKDGVPMSDDKVPMHRTGDAYGNDREHPYAGAHFATIGRNMAQVPVEDRNPMAEPTPQRVAQRLLARAPPESDKSGRSGFRAIPNRQLNLLSGTWIQAMIHDWQDHQLHETDVQHFSDGARAGCPLHRFKVQKTKDVAPAGEGGSRYCNTRTGWWDAAFLYGHSNLEVKGAREGAGGRINMPDNALPIDDDGLCAIGDQHNSWLGVACMQDLFAREHNAVADMLAAAHPEYCDQTIFNTARLVVAAEVAKIHTVDWTVELLKTPTMRAAMRVNWGGFFGCGPWLLGLVGAKKARKHGVPYALTEEFTAVYRMHPMVPDVLPVNGAAVQVADTLGPDGNLLLKQQGAAAFLQACARYPAGNLTLFNYPHSLRNLPTTDNDGVVWPGFNVDMAAIDIFRDRERGMLKFNDFRRQLNMNPFRDWRDLTGGDEEMIEALTDVYGAGGIEDCDLLIGNLAEKKIPGFAISETSFHVFIMMASRRLESDRFLTEHYTKEVYTREGLRWIRKTKGLRDVIRRHYPALEAELPKGASAFAAYMDMPAFSDGGKAT